MTRAILTVVALASFLTVGGCYLSSVGMYAQYEDYGSYEESYPGYCYDCHSAPHYQSYHGCEQYVFNFSASGYSYQPRYAEVVSVKKVDVEPGRYKETINIKGKPARTSDRKKY